VEPGDRVEPTDPAAAAPPDLEEVLSEPLTTRPLIRVGAYAWALIGILILLVASGFVIAALSTVVIPVVLALFPAAVLEPPTAWLRHRGVHPYLAAALVMLGTLALISGLVALLAPQVVDELENLGTALDEGFRRVDEFLQGGPFGLQPMRLDELVDQATEQLRGGAGNLAPQAVGLARAVFSTATATILMLIVLLFYLADGARIARWIRSLAPRRFRVDTEIVGVQLWNTIGGYIRAQLLVALVDAVFIGIGLWLLRIPLALPLGVLVFFGGLFPIVGAFLSATVAALVALATNGLGPALAVVALAIAVQFLEGNLLQPVIMGKATALHPLAVILALSVGGFLLGVLGAFLAVPVAAGAARAVGYVRQRVPG